MFSRMSGALYLGVNSDASHADGRGSPSETTRLPSRELMLRNLKGVHHDILIVGGGCTGAGAALDAASRGLKVACVEREDFSSGTSSRSTKLIWGGSRYLVQAFVQLFSTKLIFNPGGTIKRFIGDFNMVLNCHRERKYLLEKNPHLTNWLPIAVPITRWVIWPPPFGFAPAALGPLGLFPVFFKFYDSLSGFSSPPSHIMMHNRGVRKFPQMDNARIKYCSIFYEGQHDDARTNLAIAQTAAMDGANIVNYCSVVQFSKDANGKIIGAVMRDEVSKELFEVSCKSVLFCGGPFTDELRQMEDSNHEVKRAVKGASGIHIVLPAWYFPPGIGMVDMNTSDGRFLFMLPWEDHVLIGTTDKPCEPSMCPEATEQEIQWVLNEAGKYLNPEIKLRREDVLSAWSGIRPLAMDPNATSTASVSRDHLISHNPGSGAVFISGGKWTTYREMAQDAIDKVVEVSDLSKAVCGPSTTLERHLCGYEGYSENLSIILIQDFGVEKKVAERLARAYGGRARDVLAIARDEDRAMILSPGHPYIAAEVVYAARHEWALHATDVIARRTRLAFLNKAAAVQAAPGVVNLMAKELGWSAETKQAELMLTMKYLEHFGGADVVEAKT